MLKKLLIIFVLCTLVTIPVSAKPKEEFSIVLDNHLVGLDGDVSTYFNVYVRTLRVYFVNEGNTTITCKLDRPDIYNFNYFSFTLEPGENWMQDLTTLSDDGGMYKFSASSNDGSVVEVYARVRQKDEQ